MDHFDLILVKNLPRSSLANPYYAETGFRHIQMAFETSFARHQGKGVLCSMDKPRSWEKYTCARMIFLACSSVVHMFTWWFTRGIYQIMWSGYLVSTKLLY